jgi:hypothetical protein
LPTACWHGLDKLKVCFVVGGYRAIKGKHCNETYSPVLSVIILRLVLAIFAAYPHVTTTVADVEQAYLWIERPGRGGAREASQCKGLDIRRDFQKLLRGIIIDLGFTQSEHAP